MKSTRFEKVYVFIVFGMLVPFTSEAQEISLKFQPPSGHRQAMRITTEQILLHGAGPQQQEIEHSQTATFDTEVLQTETDGTATIRIMYLAIQEKSGVKGTGSVMEYDSNKPDPASSPFAPTYSALIGQAFSVKINDQGKLLDVALRDLYASVAEKIMAQEDDKFRERSAEKAEQTIDRLNQHYGSRDKRRESLQDKLERLPFMSKKYIKGLLSNLFIPLLEDPVQINASWPGPLSMFAGMGLEVQGTYTLRSVDNNSATVEVVGKRSKSDDPIIEEEGAIKRTTRLDGSYTAQLKVDLHTGQLLRREASLQLTGDTSMTGTLTG